MHNLNELNYFITIAQAGSFVKASHLIGVSSSALSHSMRNLEHKLNLRLLNRNTRSVSLTEAGQQLYQKLSPLFSSINEEIDALNDFLEMPSGTIRINAPSLAIDYIIYPKLHKILTLYPLIKLEIQSDNSWANIIDQGFDMGCRLGDDVDHDMVAVKISDPLKMVLVVSPQYVKARGEPKTIQALDEHRLIGLRISSQEGAELQWEFMKDGKVVKYQPSSQFITNNHLRKQAVLDHLGIAWLGRLELEEELSSGKLIEVLPEYAISYDAFYLYYPSRKGHSKVFNIIVEALKV